MQRSVPADRVDVATAPGTESPELPRASDVLSMIVASTFTAQPVLPVLSYWLRTIDVSAACTCLPANQIIQELLDPAGALVANAHGVNVVLIRPEDWDVSGTTLATSAEMVGLFLDALQAAVSKASASWIVVCCPPTPAHAPNDEARQPWADATDRIARALTSVPGVHVVRGDTAFDDLGVTAYYDAQADRLAQIPYTREAFAALATTIARAVHGLQIPPRKVIVLDCDQTLWGGVCGEDDTAALVVDRARRAMQEFMREQMRGGALLCLCSKNEEADVWRVFTERSDLVLTRECFVAWRINWMPKAENLRSLGEELQLGLDTFIFVDDDPRECAEVRAQLPEVVTIQLPREPAEIPALLRRVWAFDRLTVTDVDRERTSRYRVARQRDALRRQVGSVQELVRLLDLRVTIRRADSADLSRIAQLTYRTTQFNCTLRRRNEAELRSWLSRPDLDLLAVHATDRLEDYGLVGAVLLHQRGDEVHVDTLLLSCRALGRGIEDRMRDAVESCARDRGAAAAVIPFVHGVRNRPARLFLETLPPAWRRCDLRDGLCEYRLALS